MSNKNTDQLSILYENISGELETNKVQHQAILDEIKEFRKEFNGRVRRLENWKSFIVGGLSLLTVLIFPIVFIAIKEFFNKII